MNYNEEQQAQRRADAARRNRFYNGLSQAQDTQRSAALKATAARYEADQTVREREQAQAAQVAHNAALREQLRLSYIAANGSEFGFADAFPRLRAAFVEAQTLANVGTVTPASPGQVAVKKMVALHYGTK